MFKMLQRAMPLLADLARLRGRQIPQDLLAGTITAVLLIPQALAYAVLAGLPPQMGLYASVLPPVIYALLGSSRTLAVGPVAVAAVMVASALNAYAANDPAQYITGALILSALSGLILLMLAALRMGWLTHFISHPVLSGFTTGAAIFIIGTQIGPLLGISVSRGGHFPDLLEELLANLSQFNVATALIGVGSLAGLLLARRPLLLLLQRYGMAASTAAITSKTAPLVFVAIATLICQAGNLSESQGVAIIGVVPQGLPGIDLAFLKQPGWLALLPAAGMIALIGYVESISVARSLAFKRHERIDPDRELMALGTSNVAGALVGAMPVAGGFARSMVNFDAGARTQAAAIVTAAWVALAAMFFTGLLAELPKAVLAAIIIVAVFQLINFASLKRSWTYDLGDGIAQMATIIGVLLLGIEGGLLVGALLGVGFFMYRTSRPHIAVVGRIKGSEHFRNIDRHQVETWPELLLMRVDENIYFANSPRVEDNLMHQVVCREGLHHVILILSGVAYIDASGLEMLEAFERSLADKGITLHLAEVKGPVMDRLAGTGLVHNLGAERIHLSADAAVQKLGPQP